MATAQLAENKAARRNHKLSLLLRQANTSLAHLKQRADNVLALVDAGSGGFCPKQLKTLCGIIDEGRRRIQRRLEAMDDPKRQGIEEAPEFIQTMDTADLAPFVAQYRASCRLLCRALNEALRIAEAPVGAMLSDLVLRLEKQLWLMDQHRDDAGSNRHRTVSLFLTC